MLPETTQSAVAPPAMPPRTPVRALLAAVAAVLLLAACANGSQTQLPPLSKETGKVLSKEEQSKALKDLTQNRIGASGAGAR